jgi:hypothetical protein
VASEGGTIEDESRGAYNTSFGGGIEDSWSSAGNAVSKIVDVRCIRWAVAGEGGIVEDESSWASDTCTDLGVPDGGRRALDTIVRSVDVIVGSGADALICCGIQDVVGGTVDTSV